MRFPGPWTHRGVSANGIRLHVAECGEGPLVVLLHGFPELWWSWRHQLVGLAAAGHRAVAVDLRGYGDSDKPPRGYDLWTLAGDVAGLIKALGEARADVVGHGWGGVIGWTLTALHPRLVRSLSVLAAPHPLALRAGAALWPEQRAAARQVLGFQLPRRPERSLRADDSARVERIMRERAGREWAATTDFTDAVTRYRAAMQVPGVAHCCVEYYRWAVRSQVWTEGPRFAAAMRRVPQVPVLQVHGAADAWMPARTAAAAAPWAGARHRLELLADTGHFPHEERAAATTALLGEHLSG